MSFNQELTDVRILGRNDISITDKIAVSFVAGSWLPSSTPSGEEQTRCMWGWQGD